MIALTLGDFIILFIMNLSLAVLVAYFVNYAKRRAELSAEEGSSDREHLKKVIREAISEARDVLSELRVHEFNIQTGRRRLTRMNSLAEKLDLADPELGNRLWKLVNAPILLNVIDETNKKDDSNVQGVKYKTDMRDGYFKDLEWALQRCAELEKNPTTDK